MSQDHSPSSPALNQYPRDPRTALRPQDLRALHLAGVRREGLRSESLPEPQALADGTGGLGIAVLRMLTAEPDGPKPNCKTVPGGKFPRGSSIFLRVRFVLTQSLRSYSDSILRCAHCACFVRHARQLGLWDRHFRHRRTHALPSSRVQRMRYCSRSPRPQALTLCAQASVVSPTEKYVQSGCWNTSALTLASGSIMNPSVNWTPISSGRSNFQIAA